MSASISIVEISLDGKALTIEVPSQIFDLVFDDDDVQRHFKLYSHASEVVTNLLRSLLPASERPPTYKQLLYASTIAGALQIDIPPDALNNTGACSDFIDKHQEQHRRHLEKSREQGQALKSALNAVAAKATNVARWRQAQFLIDSGENAESVAKTIKRTPATVQKYCEFYVGWLKEDKTTEENIVVLSLLEELEKGVNPYVAVKAYAN